jgi:hypothetical protein
LENLAAVEDIFGPSIAKNKGSYTKIKPLVIAKDSNLKNDFSMFSTHKKITLSIDVFYIFQFAFILCHVREVKLLLLKRIGILKNGKSQDLVKAIEEIIYLLESKKFEIIAINHDGEPIFNNLVPIFQKNSIENFTCSKDQHIPDIERNIRTIKERARAICSTIPYVLNLLIRNIPHFIFKQMPLMNHNSFRYGTTLHQTYNYVLKTICKGTNSRSTNTTLPTRYIS